METTWFVIVSAMFTVYVVLDGFDFGAGIMHLVLAKTDQERRSVFAAIGPVWDGNEVWLLAGGGILFFAFPRAYSAGFSGFYLPLMMVLWLLILRGLSIEFRSKEVSPLWRTAWDFIFFASSALMAIVLGAALGNVIRGVPLDSEGFFSGPLFTNLMPSTYPGVLDWFTVLVGVFSFVMLAMHGTLYLRMKTEGDLRMRAEAWAWRLWLAVIVVGLLTTAATQMLQPELFQEIRQRPLAWVLTAVNFAGVAGIPLALKRKSESGPFYASCALIFSSLATVSTGMYPKLMISTLGPQNDMTISNAAAGTLGLQAGLWFWMAAILLAIGYFVYLFHSFKGKVSVT